MTDGEIRQAEVLGRLEGVELKAMPGYIVKKILFNNISIHFDCDRLHLLMRCAKRLLFDSCRLNYKENKASLLLISYDYGRTDHRLYWEKVRNLFKERNELSVSDDANKLVPMWQWWMSLKAYTHFLKELKKAGIDDLRYVLASDLVRLYRLVKRLEKIHFTANTALIFFDGNCTENTIIQYCMLHGIKCVTMQHGQPVFHGNNTDFQNQTMILNMTANYVIVPGEYSKMQFMAGGISESRIKVLGTLREISSYEVSKSKVFAVFLNCPTLDFAEQANMDLIETAEYIANKMKLRYTLKLHPQDCVNHYSKLEIKYGNFAEKETLVSEIMDTSCFSLLHFSGVYIDIIAKGKKAFVCKKYTKYHMADSELDLFEAAEDLERKVVEWMCLGECDQKTYISAIQKRYLGDHNSQELHIKFISEISGAKK